MKFSSTLFLLNFRTGVIICIEMTNGNIIHKLYVLEIAQMVQEITANEMLDALNTDGYISLNILFENRQIGNSKRIASNCGSNL